MTDTYLNEYLNEKEVAQIYNLSVTTLRKWRLLGRGPRFVKLGRSVRYSAADLAGWLESRPFGGDNGGSI